MRSLALILVLAAQLPVAARAAPFVFPMDCTPGLDCAVALYQDMNESAGESVDPYCKGRTADNQIGTILAVPSLASKIKVRAIAEGQVEAIESRQPDRPGAGCGNGVIIRHKGGFKSHSCGMAQNGVAVKPGQFVTGGQPIGVAGLSGNLRWPGLIFTLERYGRPYDPWTGRANTAGCRNHAPLFTVAYQEVSILQAGLTPGMPTLEALAVGKLPTTKPTADKPLTLWAQPLGVQRGDKVTFTLRQRGEVIWTTTGDADPDTKILYARKRPSRENWPYGRIIGTIEIQRGGKTVAQASASTTITP